MAEKSIDVVKHESLSANDVGELQRLFDDEYLNDFGPWTLEQPYGYAGHDVHVIARSGGAVIGHVGWERRVIKVGESEVTVAGVGGVLISSKARGSRLGGRLMDHAARSMFDSGGVEFGFLGCGEEVVPFYTSCGWHRISAAERSVSRSGSPVYSEPGPPLLVLTVDRDASSWPEGTIDLRGRAW